MIIVLIFLCRSVQSMSWESSYTFWERHEHAVFHVLAPPNVTSTHRLYAYNISLDRCAVEEPIGTSYEVIWPTVHGIKPYFELHLFANVLPVSLCLQLFDGRKFRSVMLDGSQSLSFQHNSNDFGIIGNGMGMPNNPRKMVENSDTKCACVSSGLLRNPMCMNGNIQGKCDLSSTAIGLIRNILYRDTLYEPLQISAAERCLSSLAVPTNELDIQDVIVYLRSSLMRYVPESYTC